MSSPRVLPLVDGPEFPIGVFWPPPPDATTPERYQELAATDDPTAVSRVGSVDARRLVLRMLDDHRPFPAAEQLLSQLDINLAYGTGIYWTPEAAAIPLPDGQRTPLHDAATTTNKQWLTPVGRELEPLVSVSATHANEDPLPVGADGFVPDAYVTAAEGGAVVLGQFRTDTDDGRRWLLVVNRSDRAETTARLTFATPAARFRQDTADYVAVESPAEVRLAAGAATLYRLG